MSYKASEITAYLVDREGAWRPAAEQAGKTIADAWNSREFWLRATLGPLEKCVTDSLDMSPAREVLDRLVCRFDIHVHDIFAWDWSPSSSTCPTASNSEQRTATCRRCQGTYVSDATPMGVAGYCMMCRPHVEVTCDRCAATCPGAYDGQRQCARCRTVPLGVQQYEDKQTTAIAAQQHERAGIPTRVYTSD